MIWTGLRTKEHFRYVKCNWPALDEAGEYGNITSGQIDRSFFSTTKETCDFSFTGGSLPDTTNAVRIYYGFTDANGDETETALGTFLVNMTDIEYINANGKTIASGSVKGTSMLSVLSDAVAGVAYSFEQGIDTIATAASIVRRFNLQVAFDESDHTLGSSHVFEPDDNWLTIVNWLLAQAGFGSCEIDAYGIVQLRKSSPATGSTWDFTTDDNSIIYPRITETNDYLQTPNVVRLYHEDDDCAVCAWAKLVDGSTNALNKRGGREKTLYDSVSSMDDMTPSEMLDALKEQARTKLIDNSNEIVKVKWRHPYIPIKCGHAVTVKYGKLYALTVTNMNISLSPATLTQTQGRTIVKNSLVIETGGEILWEA